MSEVSIPGQFPGTGSERMFLARSNLMNLNLKTHDGPPLRYTLDDLYGPETVAAEPEYGGWYAETRSPQSTMEHLTLNMGYEPIELYVTASGLSHAIKHWPGSLPRR